MSAVISNFTGALHCASWREDVYIAVPVSAEGLRSARVRYIVEPSGEKEHMPSSHSEFRSPSTGSGRCHAPCSFFRAIHMSLRFMPVISLRAVPCTFSLVVERYSVSPLNIGAKSDLRELKVVALRTTYLVLFFFSSAAFLAPDN